MLQHSSQNLKKPQVSHVCSKEKNGTTNFCQFTTLIWLSLLIWSSPANKIWMSMHKGLIFPFFMSRSCNKQVSRSQSIFIFTFEDFDMNFLLYKDLEYIIRKLKISSFRLYNLFFFIPFISKVTALEVRVGRIFWLFPCGVKKKKQIEIAHNFIGYLKKRLRQ